VKKYAIYERWLDEIFTDGIYLIQLSASGMESPGFPLSYFTNELSSNKKALKHS
jgi:hypothetical protein